MRRMLCNLAFLAFLTFLCAPALAVDLGEEAPEIDVTEWVSGTAVDLEAGKDKNVHVVCFLVSYSESSQAAFKQLTKVYEKYKAQGLVMLAVCDQTPEDLKKWLADNPQPFAVAADPRKNTIVPYMRGESGPPFVFIVGKPGTIFWKGSPTEGFEEALEKVMTGKYDAEHEAAAAKARAAFHKAWGTGNPKNMEAAAEKVLELDPTDSLTLTWKLRLVQRTERGATPDPTRFHEFCSAHVKKVQDHEESLNALAWELATAGSFEWRKPKLALETAKRAVEVSKGKEAAIVDSLARVYFELGMVKRAVEVQKQAVAASEEDEAKKGLKKTLSYYEKCLKVAQSEGK